MRRIGAGFVWTSEVEEEEEVMRESMRSSAAAQSHGLCAEVKWRGSSLLSLEAKEANEAGQSAMVRSEQGERRRMRSVILREWV